MALLLAGDIGGTKTILRLAQIPDSTVQDLQTTQDGGGVQLDTLYEERYASAEFVDLAPMVRQFLAAASEKLGEDCHPERACLAIAGPVVDNTSSLTNLTWSLNGERLEEELHIGKVRLINDFVAVGYGILGLTTDDLHTLQTGHPHADGPIAVLGAGTGLGEGFLIRQGGDYHVYPSEGGHADFSPRSELEFQLLKYLLDKHNITRISAERVVSGQGIVAIYQFLRDRQMADETSAVGDAIRIWERETGKAEKSVDPAAVIAQAAAAGDDHLSEQAMQMFAAAYGAEAGNLALKLLPYGGLYLAGGIAAKNLPLLESGGFLQAFSDKGRVSSLLEQVPVHIILNPQVGLIGAAIYAARLL